MALSGSLDRLELRLKTPFVSGHGSTKQVRQVVVSLDAQGQRGLGTALLQDGDELVVAGIEAGLQEIRRQPTGTSYRQHAARLEAMLVSVPAALAALDMALHDLNGKTADLSVWRLLGLKSPSGMATSYSLGVMDRDQSRAQALRLKRWPILKLKITRGYDVQCIEAIREVYPGRLWVDGNGAWTCDEAIEIAERLIAYRVELFEQPTMPGNLDDIARLREQSGLTIIADEDCRDPADIEKLAGCVDGINLKLGKCGGISRTLNMVRLAREAGLKIMLGCKTESALGVTAMAHLGSLADYLDLDGHLDFSDDPFSGLAISEGKLGLAGGPGLGVSTFLQPKV